MTPMRFHRFAWGVLAYTLVVISGGAFVRASRSGDGCGAHWPSCQGALLPDASELKTVIEFGHRLSTGIYGLLVLALAVWAFRAFPRGHMARAGAVAVLLFTGLEAWIGRQLVVFQLVGENQSVARAVWMSGHLVNTFLLVGAVALTAWWGSGARPLRLRNGGVLSWGLGLGLVCTLLLGVSGAITALGDTLFPARSLAEGLRQDMTPGAHFLIGLRVYHPVIAIASGLYLAVVAGLCMRLRSEAEVQRLARVAAGLFSIQLLAGMVNLALLAPIWMQLLHLLLADLFWVSLVLLTAAVLAQPVAEREMQTVEYVVPQSAISDPQSAIARATWKDYLALTKPRVISLLLLTTLAAMFIAAGGGAVSMPGIGLCLAVAVGLYMAAGAANAINMVLERDLDLRMGRTASRPTVTESIPAPAALRFALVLMVGSFLLLWGSANLLTAALAQAGLAFYVLVYTLLLKRRTWWNIVIGGAAGAFPPLVGWAAVTGDLSPLAWCLFGIIFLWTPVHFWALAILIKDDYARAGVPMLPVVHGERATVLQIGFYALLTVAISVLPMVLPERAGHATVGWLYLGTAAVLNGVLLLRSFQLYRQPDHSRARSLFKYSMVYLALLFLAMAVDRATTI